MKLNIPPVFVALLFAVSMYLLDRFLPVGDFDFFGREILVYILCGFAVLISLVAVFQFHRSKTTTNPMNPSKASQLVVNGIYTYTRNPMYLAMLLVLIAFGLRLGNAFNSITAAGFVYFMNHFQIKKEEQALKELFGQEYRLYCKAVRRWF